MAGLSLVYGLEVDGNTTGPLPGKVSRTKGESTVVLAIDNTCGGISSLRSTRGFEVLSEGKWVSVPATAHTIDTVTVSQVPVTATKLRYNW